MRMHDVVAPPPWPAMGMVHPNEGDLNQMLRQATMQLNDSYRPPNTTKHFDNKLSEYMDFCDKVGSSLLGEGYGKSEPLLSHTHFLLRPPYDAGQKTDWNLWS